MLDHPSFPPSPAKSDRMTYELTGGRWVTTPSRPSRWRAFRVGLLGLCAGVIALGLAIVLTLVGIAITLPSIVRRIVQRRAERDR